MKKYSALLIVLCMVLSLTFGSAAVFAEDPAPANEPTSEQQLNDAQGSEIPDGTGSENAQGTDSQSQAEQDTDVQNNAGQPEDGQDAAAQNNDAGSTEQNTACEQSYFFPRDIVEFHKDHLIVLLYIGL